jgi:hypothetical protein
MSVSFLHFSIVSIAAVPTVYKIVVSRALGMHMAWHDGMAWHGIYCTQPSVLAASRPGLMLRYNRSHSYIPLSRDITIT